MGLEIEKLEPFIATHKSTFRDPHSPLKFSNKSQYYSLKLKPCFFGRIRIFWMAHSNALIKRCWTNPEHVCSRVPVHRPHHHSILQGRAHLGNGVSFTHLVDPKIDSRAPGPHKAPARVPRNPWLLSIPSPQSGFILWVTSNLPSSSQGANQERPSSHPLPFFSSWPVSS